MKRPEPPPLPENLRELVLELVQKEKFPMLASLDGDQPRVRPVSPVRTDGFTVFVASLRSSHKTEEIDQNDKVELCYMTDSHDQVRITGVAGHVTDREVRQRIWDSNPLLRSYLGSVDNPEFVLYQVVPHRVRFMREWALEYHEVALS